MTDLQLEWPVGRCRVNISKGIRLEACNRFTARALTVCRKHVDRHEFFLKMWVDDWYDRVYGDRS